MEFVEKLNTEQHKLEQELIELKLQYKEVETLKQNIKDKEFVHSQLVAPAGAVLCSQAGNTEGCVSASGYTSSTQLASGDSLDGDGIFDNMSEVAIVTLTVGVGFALILFLVVVVYCCRRKKSQLDS